MTRLKKEIIDNPLYIEFCESNENAILKFCSSLDSLIEELIENNNISKNRVEELVILVDSANAAFANYNKKEILEIILKLKSLAGLSKKNRYEDEKILSSAKRLIEKLKKETPKIFHEIEKSDVIDAEKPIEQTEEAPKKNAKFKWIIFERNKSLFIAPFKNIEIINTENKNFQYEHNYAVFFDGDKKISAIDLLQSNIASIPPKKILIIDFDKYYAADKIGREIHSSSDILLDMVNSSKIKNEIFAGRVRLFGKNHILLRQQS